MKSSLSKEETPQKFVAKIEHEHKIFKVKKISLQIGSKAQAAPNAFDEAKANKARKRKERQESVSSLCQERKVIRSNSEERPLPTKCTENKNNCIRRVSSSGDFPKSTSDEKINSSPNKTVVADKTLTYDDHEHEKRRSHERFARPHIVRNKKHPSKRFKIRYPSKIKVKSDLPNERETSKKSTPSTLSDSNHSQQATNEYKEQELINKTEFLNLLPVELERSPSPIHTPVSPVLDFSTLHEQIDCTEPVLSRPNHQVGENTETMPGISVASNRMLSSPRNSIITTHRIYLDPDVPQVNIALEKVSQNPVEERMQKLTKQINSHKKKIKIYEADFEAKSGHKPSQIDKMNDNILRKYYAELSKFKKEHKQLSEISLKCPLMNFNPTLMHCNQKVNIQDTVNEIEQKLVQKRESANRGFNIESMTSEELIDEKVSMQKALLFLESIHGRPQNKEYRDIVRPFYDRYRILKRMVSKISNPGTGAELATIHENEAMHFVTPTSSSNDTESEQTENAKPLPPLASKSVDEIDTSFSEKLHSLSKLELLQQLKVVTEEKKVLKRKIKEFEMTVQAKSGKILTKEDKMPLEDVYTAYKAIKGRLKLLEALVSKE